ncbi:RibD family protein [Salinisphaera sp. T31B1]|uniref:RibD family protein n=1 Tax=Salinisphaera sp. T31B1 TaxID=727963 RepID=UPI0033407A2D
MIDETYAWQWLRDAARSHGGHSADAGSTRLTVDNAGRWQTEEALTDAARAMLDALVPVACSGATFVIGQLGQSLDGRIATASGHSHYVTGYASRVHLHRLRALVDAVVVGAGTVAADDPQLTVRHVEGDNPVRVVLDPRGRLGADRRLFSDPAAPTLHLTATGRAQDRHAHVRHVALASTPGQSVPAASIVARLAERGLRRVLVEGGGATVSRFVDDGVLDRLHVVVAPMLIGSGRPALSLPEIDTLERALRPACQSAAMGEDRLFDLALDRAHASGNG